MKAAAPIEQRGRVNQKQRTRTALVVAALELLRKGKSPTVAEVAEAALVSTATAYRYFPNAQSLWRAVLDATGDPSSTEVFRGVESASAEARVGAMIRSVGWRMFDDEGLWRTAARVVHDRWFESSRPGADAERLPVPTGQRMRWVREALAPLERELDSAGQRRLSMALALVFGTEAVLTLRDICGLNGEEAKQVSLWAGQALVRAALAEGRRGRIRSARPAAPRTRGRRRA